MITFLTSMNDNTCRREDGKSMFNRRGFTLVEVLIGIALLGGAVGLAVGALASGTSSSNHSIARQDPTASAESEVIKAWVGRDSRELAKHWGAPTKSADDGQGGRILYYRLPSNEHFLAVFFVDKDQKVYGWSRKKVSDN